MVVVLPTPLTPTTIITYGLAGNSAAKSRAVVVSFSANNLTISSLRITFNSAVLMYLSRATRSSIRSIIRNVVSTPTSDVTRASSKLSSTSSSTRDLPATARVNFSNTFSLVFDNPESSVSFFSLLKKLKNPIILSIF